ncbi:MAG: lipopolysaccharide biosynthesis protein, partial [Saprospiraceae bacterium]|nr:lipopolysaccharide biosynthesis protein [Saprospiraceae bacterium]
SKMSGSLKDQSIAALIWVFLDKVGSSTVNFIVTIILARLLTPEDFGLVAMVLIFFELSYSFVESGFSAALVREKNITEIDKSTTFIFNFISSIILYVLLFFAAPAIAAFFEEEALTWIVRVMGLNLIINSLAIIQRATLTQQIDFKTQTKVRFVAVIGSGIVGVIMAFYGFGVWSLVAKIGVMAVMDSLFLWILNPWMPSWRFSMESFRRLFGFGSKILLSSLIDKFFQHVVNLLIGKFFAAALLGFFTQANNFVNMVKNNLFQTIQKVSYPVLAKLQDDRSKLKEGYRQIIKLSSFVIIPGMVLLGVLAKPALVALVGEKWLPSAPFVQLLCVAGVTYHFNAINLNMLLVLGRSDLTLKLEIVKKAVIVLAIAIGLPYGIYGLVIGQVVSQYIALFINSYYSDKFLDYSLTEQVLDILPSLIISLLAGGLVLTLSKQMPGAALLILLVGSAAGSICYLGFHLLARTEEMSIIRTIIIPKTRLLFAKLF